MEKYTSKVSERGYCKGNQSKHIVETQLDLVSMSLDEYR